MDTNANHAEYANAHQYGTLAADQASDADSLRARFDRFARWPAGERLPLIVGMLRGTWASRSFNTSTWPILGPGVRIRKRGGSIAVGKFARFEEGCKIAVVSHESTRASLTIGAFSTIGARTLINVAQQVAIGDHCLIAWDCDIMDTDFHHIDMGDDAPAPPRSAPVHIGNNVWIGAHSIILKGVTIGDNSVIAAGSVVTRDVPGNSLAGGNPARVIRPIKGWTR